MAAKDDQASKSLEIKLDHGEKPTGHADLRDNAQEMMDRQFEEKTRQLNLPVTITQVMENDQVKWKFSYPEYGVLTAGVATYSVPDIEDGDLTGEALREYRDRQELLNAMAASETAETRGIDNTPPAALLERLEEYYQTVVKPLKAAFGDTIRISSGYRSAALNKAVHGSSTSDHRGGGTSDFELTGLDNKMVAEWIRDNIPTLKQLILEDYTNGQANSGWIHLSVDKHYSGAKRVQSAFVGYDGEWKYEDGLLDVAAAKAQRWIDPREARILELSQLRDAVILAHRDYQIRCYDLWFANKPVVPEGIQKQIDALNGKASETYVQWREYEKEIRRLTEEILYVRNGWHADRVDPKKAFH